MKNQIVRRFAAIALVLCLVLCCAACSKEETFKDFYKDYEYTDPYPLLDKMDKLDEFTGWNLLKSMNELLVFGGEEGLKIYNTESDATVLELASNDIMDIEMIDVGGHTFAVVTYYGSQPVAGGVTGGDFVSEATETPAVETHPVEVVEGNDESGKNVVKVYNASGAEVLSADGDFPEVNAVEDLLEVEGDIYRVGEDGALTQINTTPLFGGIPNIECKMGNYYCTYDSECVIVYDESLNEIFFWEVPYSESEECSMYQLEENLLVQIVTLLPDTDNDYDIFLDEEKYALESLILNPKDGSVTPVELDYAVLDIDEDDGYAVIGMIVDRRIQDAPSALKKVRLNSKTGEIEAELLTDLNGSVTPLVEDRFLYRSYSNDIYMLDGNGRIIGKVNGFGHSPWNESYIVWDGCLYNYDLEEVFNFEEQKLSVYATLGHSVIFRNQEGAFLLYTRSGELKVLDGNAQKVVWSNQFYALVYEDRYMLPFNEEGTFLNQELGSTSFSVISSNETEIYISIMTPEGMEYYKMYQAPTGK